ncbi:hypothetical protein DLM_2065 [Aquitalea magnusonii]|jgi:hypothetical protein|uniref:DUF3088 family protein n=1 Tax=Aquitalea magnusonii TaxID=332411 RepID=A0A3G9GHE6_9NEIS|nr:DUF3088 domain-containing protein [Aquitalea magnusonii]BBF85681.1 hypothetical protein DLM_2065 [Aquitalea magnusonii]
MSRDTLFLLEPGFTRPDHPADQRFVCPHSNLLEGLLAVQPALAERIEIRRLPFPRPRQPVIALLGEENQSLPVLILDPASPLPADAKQHAGRHFLQDARQIAAYLAQQHGAYHL